MRSLTLRTALLVSLGLAPALAPRGVDAAGPWKAQIVDAETDQPLDGVVVLAYWITYTASVGGWAGGEFYDAEEVVTAPDGRFIIPARWNFTLIPWKTVRGPTFVIFKPGYGQWRFRGADQWPLGSVEQSRFVKKAWEELAGEGTVMELPPLKTREERLNFLRRIGPPALVPMDRTKRLEGVIDEERIHLGLPRMYGGRP